MQRLRAEQKCDISQREIEEIKEDKTRHMEESEKIVDTHKVNRPIIYCSANTSFATVFYDILMPKRPSSGQKSVHCNCSD